GEDGRGQPPADAPPFKAMPPAGKTTSYVVSEERDFASFVQLTNSDDQSIRVLINQPVTGANVKKALEEAMTLKGKLTAAQRELQQVERQLAVINADQERLRKNLKEMPQEAAAYKRYLKKFDDQETQIEALQKKQKELQDDEHSHRKTYENFLSNLSVE